VDSATCNITHTKTAEVTVFGSPTANFSIAPQPPSVNTPIIFTNLSGPDAYLFKWVFGNGDSLVTPSREPLQYEYNASQTFTACLTAYNKQGCFDSVCQEIKIFVEASVDVPNAFTPLNPNNNIVYVRGFGIAKMRFVIWNRWGQKVFESNSKQKGWDGKFNGVVQPMDVYAYTLEVEFTDGTRTTKKGDITLIR
jgi:gliding motility-associated-like protein